jgi:hypothetical protein
MAKVDGEMRSGGGELAHWVRNGDRRGFQRVHGLKQYPQRPPLVIPANAGIQTAPADIRALSSFARRDPGCTRARA